MLKQSIRPWRVLSCVVFGLVIIVAWVAWRSYTPMQIKSASEPGL